MKLRAILKEADGYVSLYTTNISNTRYTACITDAKGFLLNVESLGNKAFICLSEKQTNEAKTLFGNELVAKECLTTQEVFDFLGNCQVLLTELQSGSTYFLTAEPVAKKAVAKKENLAAINRGW